MPGTLTCGPIDSAKTGPDRHSFTLVEQPGRPPRTCRGGSTRKAGSNHGQVQSVGDAGLEVAIAVVGHAEAVVPRIKREGEHRLAVLVQLRRAQHGVTVEEGDGAGGGSRSGG